MQIPAILYYLLAWPGPNCTIMRVITSHETVISLLIVQLEPKHVGTCMM